MPRLNGVKPAQMAIPLQMESVPKQLVAAMRRVPGFGQDTFKE